MAKYKITKDPITNVVLAISEVFSNTPTYSTDIIMDGADMPNLELGKPLILDDDLTFSDAPGDTCNGEMAEIFGQIKDLTEEDDYNYFVRLTIGGKSMAEARKSVQERRDKVAALRADLEEKKLEHQQHVDDFYLAWNKENDKKLHCRYYSAVILLIKNENRYLKEWLDWHLALGFDHVYIYDNGDLEHVQEIVDMYGEDLRRKITVIDWTGHHEHIQQDAYNHFVATYRHEVRWGLFIDSDEFLRFTDGQTAKVNDFLRSYEDYTEIWGYEVEYGANGLETYEDKPVRERFTSRADIREGFYWKNFIQINRIDGFDMHYARYDPDKHKVFKNPQSNSDLFVIDHYYTKSWEEWCWKIKARGGADPNYHKALREFFEYNPDMTYLDTGANPVQAYE